MRCALAASFVTIAVFALSSCNDNSSVRSVHHQKLIDVVSVNQVTLASVPVPTAPSACPADMVEVEGDYCTNAKETCLRWVNNHGETVPPPDSTHPTGRCGEWQYPTTCIGHREHKQFCIDRYEYPNIAGQRPKSWMTWYDVKAACEAENKRLCTKPEWEFACEGPDMQPYPYVGQGAHPGYDRDPTACNIDNDFPEDPLKPIDPVTGKHYQISVFDAKHPTDRVSIILYDLLKPAGTMPACVSPFGVYDMVGNIDEFVEGPVKHHWVPPNQNGGNVDHGPFISGLMSGHVFGMRNQCRAITDGHNEMFSWYETGGRCCSSTTK